MRWLKPLTGQKAWSANGSKPSAFYAIIAVATLVGTALDFTPIDPMKALYWSAVINGVVAVPNMVGLMLLAGKKSHGQLHVRAQNTQVWVGRRGRDELGRGDDAVGCVGAGFLNGVEARNAVLGRHGMFIFNAGQLSN
jgi:Mn2+/Fe2+ NRAMP family transporter